MRIDPIGANSRITSLSPLTSIDEKAQSGGANDAAESFKSAVKKAVGEVNSLQNDADSASVKLASGDIEDVHRAMIAMQKAKLALDFTIQVRNKVIDAYQEIMRMQV